MQWRLAQHVTDWEKEGGGGAVKKRNWAEKERFGVWGLGFGVWDLRFRDCCSPEDLRHKAAEVKATMRENGRVVAHNVLGSKCYVWVLQTNTIV